MRFEYQKERKRESQEKILQALLLQEGEEGQTFTELLSSTDISKPALSQRLKEMMSEGEIDKTLSKDKNKVLYILTEKSLNNEFAEHIQLYKSLLDESLRDLDEKIKSSPLSEQLKFLTETIGVHALHAMIIEKSLKWPNIYLSILWKRLETTSLFSEPDRVSETLKLIYPEETSSYRQHLAKFIAELI